MKRNYSSETRKQWRNFTHYSSMSTGSFPGILFLVTRKESEPSQKFHFNITVILSKGSHSSIFRSVTLIYTLYFTHARCISQNIRPSLWQATNYRVNSQNYKTTVKDIFEMNALVFRSRCSIYILGTLNVLILHNIESVYFFYSNPVLYAL